VTQAQQRSQSEPAAPAYPRHWEADVLLRDGGTAHLRPISPADAELLVSFYSEVSDQSKYLRFFAAMPTLSEREVRRFVDVDQQDRVGMVLTVAERIIAVGQFERLPGAVEPGGPESKGDLAEVAFLVQDKHQHRGIGQLLLEHLAQVGREVEVRKFVAEILPENAGMIQVFREAGYQVKGGYEEGVMHLEFAIDPTTTSLEVMQSREHRAETASVRRFFGARSVAVVGASRRRDTVGRQLVRNLVLGDYQGRVYVVNPSAEAVAGMPAYASVSDIPDEVDIAVVAVPSEAVPDVVLDCANKGVHGLVVVSSGFAETGPAGRRLQRQLLRVCRTYGLRLVGPNALGIINTASDLALNASLSPVMPPRGRAGFFCQSGALGVAILENVSRRGLGLSTFVSAGNRADVSGNDLLQYWEEDDTTEVVLLYLESIGNPRKFSRIARRVSRRKPVIAVKSGRTTQGVPMGHAVRASEAGQAAVDAMFRQAGVIQVDTLDEMFDVAQLLAHQPLPRGNRVAVVGNSDALALMASDAAAAAGSRSMPGAGCLPRPAPRTSSTRSTTPSTRPTSTRSSPCSSRRSTSPVPRWRPCWPSWGSSRTSRWCPASSPPRASRSCCGSPTSRGAQPAAARSRRTSRRRPRSARWPLRWSTAAGSTARSRRSSLPTRPTRSGPAAPCCRR